MASKALVSGLGMEVVIGSQPGAGAGEGAEEASHKERETWLFLGILPSRVNKC